MKVKKFLSKISQELEMPTIAKKVEGKPPLLISLAKLMSDLTEDAIVEMPEQQFSEVDYVLNASAKVAEDLKVEEGKVRDILAQEMKHYRESDPNFKEDEFSNEIANYGLKKKK